MDRHYCSAPALFRITGVVRGEASPKTAGAIERRTAYSCDDHFLDILREAIKKSFDDRVSVDRIDPNLYKCSQPVK